MTLLDEWSACRRDLYLTAHNTHNRHPSKPPTGFEPTISVGERPQIHALDCAAIWIGVFLLSVVKYWTNTHVDVIVWKAVAVVWRLTTSTPLCWCLVADLHRHMQFSPVCSRISKTAISTERNLHGLSLSTDFSANPFRYVEHLTSYVWAKSRWAQKRFWFSAQKSVNVVRLEPKLWWITKIKWSP